MYVEEKKIRTFIERNFLLFENVATYSLDTDKTKKKLSLFETTRPLFIYKRIAPWYIRIYNISYTTQYYCWKLFGFDGIIYLLFMGFANKKYRMMMPII